MDTTPSQLNIAGKRCLVTGGSGFVGSYLAERLVRLGATVCVLSRHASEKSKTDGKAIFSFDCDLRNLDQTIKCFAQFKPDIAFHYAAHPDGREDIRQAINVIETNVCGTTNALEAFRLCGGDVFIYGDSCKVFGNQAEPYHASLPMNPIGSYAISKATGWQVCKLNQLLYGSNVVSVRPTLIYGPRQSFNLISYVVRCARKNSNIILDGGTQTRDPLFIDDAVDAIIAVAGKGAALSGLVVTIGGGVEYSIREISSIILELMQINLPIIENQGSVRPTDMWRSYCDNQEAELLLGWKPATDLRTGLCRTIKDIE